jgi:integrase
MLVSKTLLGLSNNAATTTKDLLPITRPLLHQLVDKIILATNIPYMRIMYRALFLLTYHACLRAGEIVISNEPQHAINIANVSDTTYQGLPAYTLTLDTFKHSKRPAQLLIQQSEHPPYCPVQALRDYLLVRNNRPGPLFLNVDACPVNRPAFSAFLKVCVTLCGLQPDNYNTHSFRIGRATQLAQDNESDDTIRRAGRWSSTAYMSYIRPKYTALPK